ncbi:NAD(P)-dependent oxidoreductase [Neoactinobaculum massilliense]|uniref:NAD(P)-dependent oxidoreductase n=1 Tax=Neoactinobaculum massilliense TaxID=2364794 RepID=UPI000F542DAB|nr:NAD(P)-dependent oxidoreductase [Neoactinobaculum massilliense]
MHLALFSRRADEYAAIAQFQQSHPDIQLDVYDAPITEASIPLFAGVDALVASQTLEIPTHVYAAMGEADIKVFATRSAGVDMYRKDLLAKYGIRLVNVPSYSPISIAEYAFTLGMMASRKIAPYIERRAEGHNFTWARDVMGRPMRRKTVGVVGAGRIGSRVAWLYSQIGARVLAYDIAPTEAVARYATYTDTYEELLRHSDVVTFHVPASPEVHHMLDAAAIALLPEGAVVVNTARGMVVDTEALLDAVDSGHLLGAALDVYEFEGPIIQNDQPPVDELLQRVLDNPRVLYTPHTAFYTDEAVAALVADAIEGAVEIVNGGRPDNEVDL